MSKKPVFKEYEQHQLSMLPINIEDLIPENYVVRVVDRAIDNINIEPFNSNCIKCSVCPFLLILY